ncbi:MAG: SUMF1/EgtB/PvdO family nonheme iron enzyme [Flavobacteriaceae bacterium]|nr:SUMF1/EgtB/PvdO family nonheme iron enzyme [Flavobacteriaceae bacterium]
MRNLKKTSLLPLLLMVATLSLQCNRDEGTKENPSKKEEPIQGEGPKKGETVRGIETVVVEAGTFKMGLPEDEDDEGNGVQFDSTITTSFEISKYEITNAQFAEFLNEQGDSKGDITIWYNNKLDNARIKKQGDKYVVEAGYEKHPVTHVQWRGAKDFAKWVGGRLPTEAEWEYAARGGKFSKNFKYAGSDNADEVSWNKNNTKGTQPVGTKKPNELGLYDMSGNVWEWTLDWYGNYTNYPRKDYRGPGTGSTVTLRGGSFSESEKYSKVGWRHSVVPKHGDRNFGFRVVFKGKYYKQ